MNLLIAEDERKMADLLKLGLEEENHRVTVVSDGRSALDVARSYEFDVLVLDVMLPLLDGFEVARQLRGDHNRVPILMLTAKDAISDITAGLDAGADDYLTKPFAFHELLARLRALARRGPTTLAENLRVADLTLEPATRKVHRGTLEIKLSATEYRLLEFLMRRAGHALSRTAIIEAVWGFDDDIEDNNLEAFISLLRNKVDKGFSHRLIRTIRGFGYSIRKDS
jgi:DNA-binding response OmpR family regulator